MADRCENAGSSLTVRLLPSACVYGPCRYSSVRNVLGSRVTYRVEGMLEGAVLIRGSPFADLCVGRKAEAYSVMIYIVVQVAALNSMSAATVFFLNILIFHLSLPSVHPDSFRNALQDASAKEDWAELSEHRRARACRAQSKTY
ncbi:hypothetical protein DENSPDRAFT_695083 [Dentipellis sp. KUC8613]|nr:hypothetical protein DENSPDRAFT_695083 [Dentipellis sp. KUC8613]